ncbi:NupC/NupG family nucleoside CNT transporter [Candidatus Babeliales bacterium]|nr:NupC/NupG family nucleoside CNT transporter [Candidatus Babeliales bacterium]
MSLLDTRYIGVLGIVAILLIAYLFSNNRKKISFKLVGNALLMQFLLAFFILKTAPGRFLFKKLAAGFSRVYEFATAGSEFVFGTGPWAMIFAIKVASIIIFFGALMSVLFHLGIIQVAVRVVSFLVRPLLGTSGAETLCAAANSMLGQTEAPLLIKHYLEKMTTSEILVVMVSGMGTLSGAILAVYGSIGVPMMHLLSASVMAIPGSILISKILLPETEKPETVGKKQVDMKSNSKNILDAITTGTTDGLGLAVNVLAMLITFISLIAMINYILSYVGFYTLNDIFSAFFGPFAFLLGVPKIDTQSAGALLGQKLVINEFVAYSSMVNFAITEKTKIILTYALAGFSNFSCIGIQIGGIGAIAPKSRDTLVKLGMRALLGGTLTNFLNAAIASLLI